jgi:YesN/AraC family two-component response regulator
MEIETTSGHGTHVTHVGPRERPAEGSRDPRAGSAEPLPEPAPPPSAASGRRIRILLVDDHKIVREGLASLIRGEPDLEIVGETGNPAEALEMIASSHPNVVVLDVNLPEMNGIQVTRILKRTRPEVRVVGLSMHGEHDIAAEMKEAGASAYLLKGGPATDLIDAIRASVTKA